MTKTAPTARQVVDDARKNGWTAGFFEALASISRTDARAFARSMEAAIARRRSKTRLQRP